MDEEGKKKIEEMEKKLAELAETSAKQISDLTAERSALQEMLDNTKKEMEGLKKDLDETKKLNFILAKSADQKPKETFDDALLGLVGIEKGGRNGNNHY